MKNETIIGEIISAEISAITSILAKHGINRKEHVSRTINGFIKQILCPKSNKELKKIKQGGTIYIKLILEAYLRIE